MIKIFLYSALLIAGMAVSQIFDLTLLQPYLGLITMGCLSYIMIEVGLEFVIDKNNLPSYLFDYLVAMTAAAFPWIFCALYFYFVIGSDIKEALLVGRFAAPTSAGVLFAMLAAVGLGTTWLFKKARILAIFDDLDTIILLIPLQIMIVGFRKEVIGLLFAIAVLIIVAYRYLHRFKIPTARIWFILYSVLILGFCHLIESIIHVKFEVLLPAFVFGCVLYNPHDPSKPEQYTHEHAYIEPMDTSWLWVDWSVKNLFMFLVGCSIPKISMGTMGIWLLVLHVAILTLLSNIGKMFPSFCYRKEATIRERIALSVAMFPRGEVGAGVLLLALEYGFKGDAVSVGGLSLALNLLLTGLFVFIVIKLIEPLKEKASH